MRTIWFGFTDANLNDLDVAQWIGLDNFLYLMEDESWWQAVRNTLMFASISVVLETIFGLIVALVLNAHFKGRPWVRTAVLIPWAIPKYGCLPIWPGLPAAIVGKWASLRGRSAPSLCSSIAA